MEVKKLKAFGRLNDFCFNKCPAKLSSDGSMVIGYRAATHVFTMGGQDTHVCGPCAKNWRATWDEMSSFKDAA